MTRRMSCSMTVDGVLTRRKTVTRRHVDTWTTLRPGDKLTLVEKAMGLPKGARQVVLAEVEIVSNDIVRLDDIDDADIAREALDFPTTREEFCRFWLAGHKYNLLRDGYVMCRRIEWRYLAEGGMTDA